MNQFNLIPKLVQITFNRSNVAFIGLTILLATSQALQHATAQNVNSESTRVDTM